MTTALRRFGGLRGVAFPTRANTTISGSKIVPLLQNRVFSSITLNTMELSRWNRTGSIVNRNQRMMQTESIEPPMNDKLPDPQNPYENPLANVGDEELSETKKYWRKRQSKTSSPIYIREVNDEGFAVAVGKRKSSVARVWLRDGDGQIMVNDRHWVEYFPRVDHREQILRPLLLLGKASAMNVKCTIRGGGSTGQAEALRHGIARAMLKWNPEWRKTLKSDGLLTRDSRVVESKKYGRKKARKSFTWVKR